MKTSDSVQRSDTARDGLARVALPAGKSPLQADSGQFRDNRPQARQHHALVQAMHDTERAQTQSPLTQVIARPAAPHAMQMRAAVAINDDAELEREADIMGEHALHAGAGSSQAAQASAAPTQPTIRPAANVSQRKLLLDPGTVSYSIDGAGQDYAYVGKYEHINRYVRYGDLPLLKTEADNLWTDIKTQDFHGGSNMARIKTGEQTNDFSARPDLAPGEEKYEDERTKATKNYLIGIVAPGKEHYKGLVKDDGAWKDLQLYHADNEDDDNAASMTGVPAGTLAAGEKYELFVALMQQIMINQGEPFEKSEGGKSDRTAKAKGKVYIKASDAAGFVWDSADNPYREKLAATEVVQVPSLDHASVPVKNMPLDINGKKVVYATTEQSKARTSANFYIVGKPYTQTQITAKKTDTEITTPWTALKSKTPAKQHAETFSRKDRGKGQADAMGKWSANAAVAVSNAVDGTGYDVGRAWEWLHLRGAGLGGATAAGNLTPGTYSANSEMIPIENKIKSLKSNPKVSKIEADFEPKNISGVFAKQIEIAIKVTYKGILAAQTGSWTIDAQTGAVFDKMHEKRLQQDVEGKLDEPPPASSAVPPVADPLASVSVGSVSTGQVSASSAPKDVVGDSVAIIYTNGLMSGPHKVIKHIKDDLYLLELEEHRFIAGKLRQDGCMLVEAADSDDE
ncbi:hypothetical protein [Herbaspirillum sp. RV1423]|uniref:hypothetical protein n=1 Tax=Herbaspirillum sp. RV1423 TaxID=1443993 RepID=UPI00054FA115|nr:hypothetical protein [Herbaspirillum sp. RV1423]